MAAWLDDDSMNKPRMILLLYSRRIANQIMNPKMKKLATRNELATTSYGR